MRGHGRSIRKNKNCGNTIQSSSKNSSSSSFEEIDEIDEIVAEYLEHRQFTNTLECFRSESRHRKLRRDRLAKSDDDLHGPHQARGEPSQTNGASEGTCINGGLRETGPHDRNTLLTGLLEAFDAGNMLGFLSAWSALIPKPLLRREAPSSLAREVRAAEFLACVHFAVVPFRASSLEKAAGPRDASIACAKSMSAFRRYLDSRARGWTRDPELVDFFTLPHVPDPSSHTIFGAVFDDAWLVGVRARVENVLGAVDRWRPPEPLLVKLLRDRNMADVSRGKGKGVPAAAAHAVGDGDHPHHHHLHPNPHPRHNHHHRRHGHRQSEIFMTSTDVDFDDNDDDHDDNKYDHLELGREATRERAQRNADPTDHNRHHDHLEVDGGMTTGAYDGVSGGNGGGASFMASGSAAAPAEATQSGQPWRKGRPQVLRSDSDRAILGRVDYDKVKRDLRRLAGEVAGGSSSDRARPQSAGGDDRGVSPDDAERRSSAAIEAALVLQTLRWRFSHAPAGKTRRGVLYHLIRHDIFDLRAKAAGSSGVGDEGTRTAAARGGKNAGNDRPKSLLEILVRLGSCSASSDDGIVSDGRRGTGLFVGTDDESKETNEKQNAEQSDDEEQNSDQSDDEKQNADQSDDEEQYSEQSVGKNGDKSGVRISRITAEGGDGSDQSSESGLVDGPTSGSGIAETSTKGDGNPREACLKSGWEEFDGEPGRLVAEYAVRLLGVLASMSKARSYILAQNCQNCADTIGVLVEALNGEAFRETALAKKLLGVLARLSGRRSAQEAIANSGFVHWAAKMLGCHHSPQGEGSQDQDPCPLFLRRTATVLGNVFRTVLGRGAGVVAAPDLLGSLANLLEHEDGQVRSNAIVAFKALLGAEEARERALATGTDALLQDLTSRTSKSNSNSNSNNSSRKSGHDLAFVKEMESLLELLTGKKVYPEDEKYHAGGGDDGDPDSPTRSGRRGRHRSRSSSSYSRDQNRHRSSSSVEGGDAGGGGGGGDAGAGAGVREDVEDCYYPSDDDPEEALVVSNFVQSTNAPCGEELLRRRYRLSTAEANEEAVASGTSWGGEEEELVCGSGGGGGGVYANRRPHRNGVGGESKGESATPRMPTPEAGTATVIRGEEKVYDSRRPGLPEEMQSRPMIPRTPAVAMLAMAMEKRSTGVAVERGV